MLFYVVYKLLNHILSIILHGLSLKHNCLFFKGLEANEDIASGMSGIYSLEDIKQLGAQKGVCPYFFVRRLISSSNIIVYNYQYMLDPKIANSVSSELEKVV